MKHEDMVSSLEKYLLEVKPVSEEALK